MSNLSPEALSPEAQRALDLARGSFEPTGERLRSMRAALQARLDAAPSSTADATSAPDATGATDATAPSAPAAVRAKGLSSASMIGLSAVLALVGAAALVLLLGRADDRAQDRAHEGTSGNASGSSVAPKTSDSTWMVQPSSPSDSASPESASTADEETPAASSVAPLPLSPSGSASSSARSSAPKPAATASQGDTLVAEAALVGEARAAAMSGNGSRALELLDKYRALYPRPILGQEATATRILALCAGGRVGEARTLFASFEKAAPHSPHLARLRSSCAGTRP